MSEHNVRRGKYHTQPNNICDRSVCLVGVALLIEGLAIQLNMKHLQAQVFLVIYQYFVDLN